MGSSLHVFSNIYFTWLWLIITELFDSVSFYIYFVFYCVVMFLGKQCIVGCPRWIGYKFINQANKHINLAEDVWMCQIMSHCVAIDYAWAFFMKGKYNFHGLTLMVEEEKASSKTAV